MLEASAIPTPGRKLPCRPADLRGRYWRYEAAIPTERPWLGGRWELRRGRWPSGRRRPVAACAAGVACPSVGVGAATAGATMVVAAAAVGVIDIANLAEGVKHAMSEGRSVGRLTAKLGQGQARIGREMAREFADDAGHSRVSGRTAGGKQVDIDLVGKGHFDKVSGQAVKTPHVHEARMHRGPGWKTNTGSKSMRPATAEDNPNSSEASREGVEGNGPT